MTFYNLNINMQNPNVQSGLNMIAESMQSQPNTIATCHRLRSQAEIFLNNYFTPAPKFDIEYDPENKSYSIKLS